MDLVAQRALWIVETAALAVVETPANQAVPVTVGILAWTHAKRPAWSIALPVMDPL